MEKVDIGTRRLLNKVNNLFHNIFMTKELLSGIKTGTDAAWEHMYAPPALNTLKNVIRQCRVPESEIEDVLQNTMEKVLKALRGKPVDPGDNIFGYFMRAAQNCAIDHLRSTKRHPQTVDLELFQETHFSDSGIDLEQDIEVKEEVEEIKRKLKPQEFTALLLKSQGYKDHEVSPRVGRSTLAIKTMVFRARDKVREHMAT